MKHTPLAGALALALVLLALPALAGDDKAAQTTHDQMMEAMAKAATPGPGHKVLEQMVGTWNATTTMYGEPGQPPMVSQGKMVIDMVLGGRYARMQYQSEFNGMKMEGLGFTGYDNVEKKYVSDWMDTMGTGIMRDTGTYDPATRTITSAGAMTDPMGAAWTTRSTTQFVGADKMILEMYGRNAGAPEIKLMQIVYTRAK